MLNHEAFIDMDLSIPQKSVIALVDFFIINNIPFRLAAKFEKKEGETNKYMKKNISVGCTETILVDKSITEAGDIPPLGTDVKISLFYSKYIDNISEFPLPDIEQLAAEFNISVITLKDRFKQRYQKTLYVSYMEKRMEHAAMLLKKGHTATDVTRLVGYGPKSAIKFNKMFQKHFGLTPKSYQMQHYGSQTARKRVKQFPKSNF